MPIRIVVTRDFDHMSEVAAEIAKAEILTTLQEKPECVLGLATGNSPTGMYKHLAKAANCGEFDSSKLRSFNLDEYVGLPGENSQLRTMHPESYSFFMIQEFLGLLSKKIPETNVPYGTLIDQKKLIAELKNNPDDWREQGTDQGRSIAIKAKPASVYLAWIRKEILDAYTKKIRHCGGIDLQVVGVGGRGHVAFHESGIPFAGSNMLLVKLDDNTIANAVVDGHFASTKDCPRYAISMGAELVYQAKTILLLACGQRKIQPLTDSLLSEVTPDVPISYGQTYAAKGGNLIYVIDKIAAANFLHQPELLKEKGIALEDLSKGKAKRKVKDIRFFRDPNVSAICC